MKKKVHPAYNKVTITCACGATFETLSTRSDYQLDVCSSCHPFYTGSHKLLDAAGRVEKFQSKFKNWDAAKAATVTKKK